MVVFYFIILLLVFSNTIAFATLKTIWPQPQQVSETGLIFQLDSLAFYFNSTGAGSASPILADAFQRYRGIIFLHTNAVPACEKVASSNETISECIVDVSSADETLSLETDVSYKLVVDTTITITAKTVYGALNGLESLSQLVDRGTFIQQTSISDFPRYQIRATMIDTSRHYYPLEAILQHLDAMAYSKFNVLHWHIVDEESFPYQSTKFPEMSAQGAYSPDHVYTVDDINQVVTYAKNRGIRVIPEFDTPGHVQQGYRALDPPILTQCYGETGHPTVTGPLDPTLDDTYSFLTELYAEIQTIFPDRFVHVGGDEVDTGCWGSNPGIQAYMKAHNLTIYELETLFEQKLLKILDAQNSSYIVWQEVFDNGGQIAADTVVDVWKAGMPAGENFGWQDEMARVTKAGFHTILSAPFYLNKITYGEDWPTFYGIEPSNFTGGDEATKAGLVGGIEACMWSEYVDASNFIPRLWARAAAVGERGWSAQDVTDVNSARDRLHEFRCKLLARGINAEPLF